MGYVFQNPNYQIFCASVRDEIKYGLKNLKLPEDEIKTRTKEILAQFGLTSVAKTQPVSLSGGTKKVVALASVCAMDPSILLLDEPTKGLDAYAKAELAQLLQELCREGTSILIVTHDVEFAARYATGCALMFDGLLLSEGEPHDFFAGNRFYTTDANRIAAEHFPMDITCEEVIASCRSSLSAKEPEPPRG